MKRKIREIIKNKTQKIADGIIEKMKKAKSDDEFQRLFEVGMRLDSFCIAMWNIYFD